MHTHIDGDIIKYRAAFAAEKTHYQVGDEVFNYKKEAVAHAETLGIDPDTITGERVAEPVANALFNAESLLTTIQKNVGSTGVTVHLSGKGNYREDIGTLIYADRNVKGYKANRKDAPRPTHGQAVIDYIVRNYPVELTEGEEADDSMGIAQFDMYQRDPKSTCIATIDKDLDMIPGYHYHLVREEVYNVDQFEANLFFWTQLLAGDSTDNIPGIKGMGMKTATKYLGNEFSMLDLNKEMYEKVLLKYNEQYGDKGGEALLENARLIWIRRQPNELWSVPA